MIPTNPSKKYSRIRISWVPIFISFVFATVELFSTGDVAQNYPDFLLTNIFGLILSLTIELHKRWASESRMAHFAEYLPTSSPIFSDLVKLVERVDSAYRRIGDETLVERAIGVNPIESGLRQTIWEATTRIQSLSEGQVITPHYDNRLSITLSENVELIRGISIAETDVAFWKSEQGLKYLQTQKRISLNYRNSDYSSLTKSGVYRIFCLDGHSDSEVKEMIVEQVRSGVTIALFRDDRSHDLPPDELGIFGNICVRKTRYSTSRSSDAINQYSFSKADVQQSMEDFEVLWNQSRLVTTEDFSNFSLPELEEFFRS